MNPPPTPAIVRSRSSRPRPRLDQWKRSWHLLRRNTLALVGLGVLLTLLGIALFASTLPIPWNEMSPYCSFRAAGCTYVCTYSGGAPPGPNCYPVNANFPSFIPPTLSVGTGAGQLPLGSLAQSPSSPIYYNLLSGILRGADWSLAIAFLIVVSAAGIGILVGGASGYFGGAVDESLMRVVDMFLSIPSLLFVIITATVFSTFTIPGLTLLASRVLLLCLAFIVVTWPLYARIVRGQVLVVREQKYVEAARASGARGPRVLFRHILPNSVYPVFIQMSLDFGGIPILVGALAFLGFNLFGLSTTQVFPEWGSLSAYSVNQFGAVFSACSIGACVLPWWQILFSGSMLFLLAISVNFFADGLRDTLDPRSRR